MSFCVLFLEEWNWKAPVEVCVCVCMSVCLSVCISWYIGVCMCVHVSWYVYVYVKQKQTR